MIYVDSSVALAQVLAEDRVPPLEFWESPALVSSRLLEYEVWNRINAYGLRDSHEDAVRSLLARFAFVELAPQVLSRALEPFPATVRTLDALHLATITFLRDLGQRPSFATFDTRLTTAAIALDFPLATI